MGAAMAAALAPMQASAAATAPKPKESEGFKKATAERIVQDFLSELNRYFAVIALPPGSMLAYASCFLKGEASIFFESMRVNLPDLSWLEFKAAFINAFDAVDNEARARDQLHALSCKEKDGVESYCRQFVAVLARLPVGSMSEADRTYNIR